MRVTAHSNTAALLEVFGDLRPAEAAEVVQTVCRMLRLEEDLSGFYLRAEHDPDLSWAADEDAGRILRSASAFEDVIKTICTTNCTWSATERMVEALVSELGPIAPSLSGSAPRRAFPAASVLAEQNEDFYSGVMRAGYRGQYIRAISVAVANGTVNLEELTREHPAALADREVENLLLSLPGVGPYATAHIMMMLGRFSRLVFDSWTVPKYRNLTGRHRITTKGIERRFRRYGEYAGLAFWLYLTRDWL